MTKFADSGGGVPVGSIMMWINSIDLLVGLS